VDIEKLIAQENKLSQLMNQVIQTATEGGAVVRSIGALAIRAHCPRFRYIEYQLGRYLTDFDLVAYSRDREKLEKIIEPMNFKENREIRMMTSGERLLYLTPDGMHFDIFFDRLNMCHEIDLKGRLELDYPTVSLVDLLLAKMQIVEINEKDLIDTMVLLLEHNLGNTSKETVDVLYLRSLCAWDWGLWRTVTMNLEKVKNYLLSTPGLSQEDREDGVGKVAVLLKEIEAEPKSLKWRIRAKIGDKKRWYRDVSELMH
jgi:hypothetical protein